jgi:hypothetical protein
MPSGLRKTSGNHFEIYYEKPWGGVASDSDPVDIADNELVAQVGVVVVDGALAQINFVADPAKEVFDPTLSTAPTTIFATFGLNGSIYAIDVLGGIYQLLSNWTFIALPPDAPWVIVDPVPPHRHRNQPGSAVIVINGTAYISNFLRNTLYTFDGFNYLIGSDYVAGLVFGILDDYLLQMNTNTNITAGSDGRQPMRINWSGPGKFTTWDASIDRTAGFNTLAGVEDRISGFLSFASVGVALTAKGLVQLSPTGIGVAPFSFTTLWTSAIGKGCIYTYTVVQYGEAGYFLTDSGVYKVSTAGISEVSLKARTAILNSLNLAGNNTNGIDISAYVATVMLYALNSSYPTPFYVLAGFPLSTAPGEYVPTLVIWLMDLNTGIWSQILLDVMDAVNQQYAVDTTAGFCSGVSLSTDEVLIAGNAFLQEQNQLNPLTILTVSYTDTNTGINYVISMSPYIYTRRNVDNATNYARPLGLAFKAEEIKIGYTRKPTMRRVVVKAYGFGDLQLNVTDVDGVVTSLGTITLNGTTNAKTYYSPKGIGTVECPQLSITSTNFKGVIVKAMMTGTFADGDID